MVVACQGTGVDSVDDEVSAFEERFIDDGSDFERETEKVAA